jgi:hypothetical protein
MNKIIFSFVIFVDKKKVGQPIPPPPPFFAVFGPGSEIRDPGCEMDKNYDPG